jgi:hypothetical protein
VRYTRAFRPSRYLKADGDTLLLYRFEGTDEQRFHDASSGARHAEPVGTPAIRAEER